MSSTAHLAVLLAAVTGVAVGMNVAVDREGRLMLTTETFTTTISTDRYCYTTEKKLLGPKTKECESKRAIDTAIIMGLKADTEKVAEAIRPTNAVQKAPEEESALSSGQSENPRNGRFCCYVVTKTDTMTSYVITATTSVTLKCTPARSILPMCSGDDKKGGLKDKFDFGDKLDFDNKLDKEDTAELRNQLGKGGLDINGM